MGVFTSAKLPTGPHFPISPIGMEMQGILSVAEGPNRFSDFTYSQANFLEAEKPNQIDNTSQGIRRDARGIQEIAIMHANSTRMEAMFFPPDPTREARPNAGIHRLTSIATSTADPSTSE
ncbi:hypothetical protein R1flu_007987 [Riccia fluitans]|uniref:Uncharacterized protein n=1 Tax=Riccia fluitans TaxID=41844 RepID=A0ABD1YAG1_9MARC